MRCTFKTVFYVNGSKERNAYQGIGTEYETLLRAFDKENAAFAKRVGKDRAKNTYNKYLVVRKYVAEFIKYQYKRSDMSMNELTAMTEIKLEDTNMAFASYSKPFGLLPKELACR